MPPKEPSKNLIPPEVSKEMIATFLKDPYLAEGVRKISALFIDSIDNNYFTKEITEEEKGLVKHATENFKDRDATMEVRLYKAEHLLYAMLKTLEEAGIIHLIDPMTNEERIKEHALEIWEDYKKKKSVV